MHGHTIVKIKISTCLLFPRAFDIYHPATCDLPILSSDDAITFSLVISAFNNCL